MGELFNRVADVWRPLYQVADVLGGEWPKRVRDAAATLVPRDDDAEEELVQLLTTSTASSPRRKRIGCRRPYLRTRW
jgi:hypothetical protein